MRNENVKTDDLFWRSLLESCFPGVPVLAANHEAVDSVEMLEVFNGKLSGQSWKLAHRPRFRLKVEKCQIVWLDTRPSFICEALPSSTHCYTPQSGAVSAAAQYGRFRPGRQFRFFQNY